MRIALLPAVLFALVFTGPIHAAADAPDPNKLVIHEWGTFTALQDETGRAIGGINVNDEPLPKFVHRIGPGLFSDSNGSKGISLGHPDVTMRLETPVIYFYPPRVQDKLTSVDVSATFNGGMLSEFYPNADTTFDGKPSSNIPGNITASTQGGLTWHQVMLGDNVSLPVTNSHVWIAPRNVKSSPVTVGKEAEQYIFYRGVGHIPAPLTVQRDGEKLHILPANSMQAHPRWLAEFRADGTCAYERLTDQRVAGHESEAPTYQGTFRDKDFSADHLTQLKAEMRQSLIGAGLFAEEADAMLETWKLSYFTTVGQRLFFLVPREWTDRVLPLTISMPCELTRVMMGRIELVTPEQRLAIQKLADPKAKLDNATAAKLRASLGRFPEAIVADEARKHAPAAVSSVN